MTGPARVPVAEVSDFVTRLFTAAGLSVDAARRVAAALIEADMAGRASHGVLQAEGYLLRLIGGTMSIAEKPEIVSQDGAVTVLDALDMQGHLAAEEAMAMAVEQAKAFGVSVVAVRRAMHFGVLGRYVRMAAEQGCAAFGMVNSKAVMPAPGGAEKLVGTNPFAVAFPVAGEGPVVLDMATTAGTIGGVRAAMAAGKPLPEGWAVDAEGVPTTDPVTALAGMLLPTGGAKGFGLGFVVDLLPGLLASGGWGDALGEIRSDKPFNASFLFIVLDIARFRPVSEFEAEARKGVERVRNARKAPGTERLVTPGERSAESIAENDGTIPMTAAVAGALAARAEVLGVPLPPTLARILQA